MVPLNGISGILVKKTPGSIGLQVFQPMREGGKKICLLSDWFDWFIGNHNSQLINRNASFFEGPKHNNFGERVHLQSINVK